MSASAGPRCERGAVYWVELDPVQGSEMAKTRPCVIVSAQQVNAVRRTVVIVPLTTTQAPENWPLLVSLPSGGQAIRARTEQVRAVDKSRLLGQFGALDADAMDRLSAALVEVLELD